MSGAKILLVEDHVMFRQCLTRNLNLSASTVKTHLRTLYQKLSVKNRAEAVVRGLECGLISRRFRA